MDTQATRRPRGQRQASEGRSCKPRQAEPDPPEAGTGGHRRADPAPQARSGAGPRLSGSSRGDGRRRLLPARLPTLGSPTPLPARPPTRRFPSCLPRPPPAPSSGRFRRELPSRPRPPRSATPLTAARGLRPHTRVSRVLEALGTHAHVAPGSVVTVLVLARARLLRTRALVYVCNRDARWAGRCVRTHGTTTDARSRFAPAPESDIGQGGSQGWGRGRAEEPRGDSAGV